MNGCPLLFIIHRSSFIANATPKLASTRKRARRRLGRRPRIILFARGASARVPVRGMLGRAGPLRPHVDGAETALHARVVSGHERDGGRQLRAATELGGWPQLRDVDV